jgi:hypothetical protein
MSDINASERYLEGESHFIPVGDTADHLDFGDTDPNPSYSYIDNPDIKAELAKLD